MWISSLNFLILVSISELCCASNAPGTNDTLHCCMNCREEARECALKCVHPLLQETGCMEECQFHFNTCTKNVCNIVEYLDPVLKHYDNDCALSLE
ncbi:unnamed protein product [Dicrocoelium dendriticum]|nr:unnamed protein product [Dicrocoelium dendriticum]